MPIKQQVNNFIDRVMILFLESENIEAFKKTKNEIKEKVNKIDELIVN